MPADPVLQARLQRGLGIRGQSSGHLRELEFGPHGLFLRHRLDPARFPTGQEVFRRGLLQWRHLGLSGGHSGIGIHHLVGQCHSGCGHGCDLQLRHQAWVFSHSPIDRGRTDGA